uniref:Phosphoinositide 3-kinase regulatory subunit 5 n=1 Tax=Colobus angolensis palliatus TaxID=336983 RepID=A0A2K5IGD0_COLAP
MQPGVTTCTEDRIQHALERCLHGLSLGRRSTSWSAGLCLNCWSLQELVSRDPGHFLILLEQILQKTREVQEKGTYDLLTPLALLFYSTVLCTPHFPPDSDLLLKAASTYHRFLTWPVPYCSICQELLTFIDAELKAPGISYQRLVRAEQGLPIRSHRSSTVPRPWQSLRTSSRRPQRHRSWRLASEMLQRPGGGSGRSCRRWEKKPASLGC